MPRAPSEVQKSNQAGDVDATDRSVSRKIKEEYDTDTIVKLLSSMAACGYGNGKQQQKTRKKLFEDVVAFAEKEHGIKRTAEGWSKKFARLKKVYSRYVDKVRTSGLSGDEPELKNKPEFYAEIHELEHSHARHNPPAAISSEIDGSGTVDGSTPTSTRKRASSESVEAIREMNEMNAQRHSALLLQLEKNNATRERLVAAFETIASSLNKQN